MTSEMTMIHARISRFSQAIETERIFVILPPELFRQQLNIIVKSSAKIRVYMK